MLKSSLPPDIQAESCLMSKPMIPNSPRVSAADAGQKSNSDEEKDFRRSNSLGSAAREMASAIITQNLMQIGYHFGTGSRGEGLDIGERLDIAIDIAHAITYLHMYTDHPIIHRDIKASNILLTEKLRAKVADFGFARLAEQDPKSTHVSTQVKGTFGYLDPEYLRTYHLTEKSDVYSYGVLLVEIVTGRHPIERDCESEDRITTKWAIRKMEEGNVEGAIDPRVRRSAAAAAAAKRMIGLAAQCVVSARPSRPSMKQCAEALWKIRRDYWQMQRRSTVLNATRGKRAVGKDGGQPILNRRGTV